jgi:signal transduction histidine kinase
VFNEYDESISEYHVALLLSDSLPDKRKKAMVLSNLGVVFRQTFNTDSTLFYLNKTTEYSERHKIKDIHAKALFELGSLYLKHDDYITAAKYLLESRDAYESLQDSNLLTFVYSTLGILYLKVNNFDESLANFKKAIQLDESIPETNNLASYYSNIGELYFRVKKDPDTALDYYRMAIPMALPYQKETVNLASYVNIGNVFIEKMAYDSAEYYYQKAYNTTNLLKYPDKEAAVFVNLGILHLKKKDYDKARFFLEKGYEMSKKLNLLLFEKNALNELSKLDSISGNLSQSMEYYKLYHSVYDSIQESKAKNEIAILEFNKQLELKKFNNDLLLQQNNLKSKQITTQRRIIWISLSASLLLLILIYTLYVARLRRKKLLNQLSEKHHDLILMNEELKVTNETLTEQQEQLKELNITKDKFFSILGHDLKSPFNGLLGMLDLLDKQWDTLGNNEKHGYIHSLLKSSEKTYQLLEDMLIWGKAQQGLIKYQPETFLLQSKITLIIDYYNPQIFNKKLVVNTEIPADLQLTSDPNLITRIVQNLLHNAIKYTPSGGKITITSKIDKTEQLCLCISDTGIGIPDNKIANIFGLDCDFNRPGTNNEKSSGMGLILIREYAEIIGGTLTVSSTEGKGSTFCLCLKKNNF